MSVFGDEIIKNSVSIGLDTDEVLKIMKILPEADSEFSLLRESQKNKYNVLDNFNVDQFIHFLIILQRILFSQNERQISNKIYFYLRTRFCIDLYPDREFPKHFLLVHPLASVLGRAKYGDWFVCYQHVTCGGNSNLEYPTIGAQCVLFTGAKVIGRSKIGDNCIIGAGCIVYNENIDDNTVIYSKDGKNIKKNNKKNNKKNYFKD
ncbi:MAG: hypothetical protein F3745_04305 [Nitrospinae bacterium]|nr:hypothetical protein [Nitrospinota bacterium]